MTNPNTLHADHNSTGNLTMNRDRWNYIKNLRPAAPRMVHLSCEVAMLPHPMNPEGPRVMPWVGRGNTYEAGRNKSKRTNRDADIAARKAARRA